MGAADSRQACSLLEDKDALKVVRLIVVFDCERQRDIHRLMRVFIIGGRQLSALPRPSLSRERGQTREDR